MTNRREFLAQALIAGMGGSAPVMADTQPAVAADRDVTPVSAPKDSVSASKPLRILILGGTGFIGPHHLRAALDRGHTVSVFNRGKSSKELPSGVEQLIGDRNGDLESIKNRDWDAVIDTATYGPIWIRTLGEALKGTPLKVTFGSL